VKKLLYVLRTTLTGAHALKSGEIVTEVTALLDEYGFAAARELLEQKRRGEMSELPEDRIKRWREQTSFAFQLLDTALEQSHLPEEPPNVPEMHEWVLSVRRARF
jgi:hypothetical protein